MKATCAVGIVAVLVTGHTLRAQAPEAVRPATATQTYVGADYGYSYFYGDIDPWQIAAVSLGRRGSRGSFIGRVNMAQRFGSGGAQGEVDAYPRIRPGMYAYLNAGFSEASIFPRWRSGGELFLNLRNAWEASAGYRQLRFGGPPVTLLTGAVGKYIGNSWLSLRPYVRVKPSGVSASLGLTGRRYGADGDNFIGGRVSAGTSPSDRIDPSELARTRSWTASLQGSRTVGSGVTGTWSIGTEGEQLSSTTTRHRLELNAGVRKQF